MRWARPTSRSVSTSKDRSARSSVSAMPSAKRSANPMAARRRFAKATTRTPTPKPSITTTTCPTTSTSFWLDPEMVYSCAYFETGKEDLATAQLAKLRHLCRKLRLQPGEKLLDVGCGWGAGAPGRSRVRRRGHRHHIEQGAAGARPGAGQGRRPGGPGHPQAAGLPRPAARWPLRQGGQRRYVRARRARQPGAVLPATVRCGASRRPGDEPRHHLALHRRPPGWQGGRRLHRSLRVSPRRARRTCRWRWRG